MFGPQTADSLEISAHYYRKESEAWAANERLARLARGGGPGLLARALSSLGSLFGGQRAAPKAATAEPALLRPLAAARLLRPEAGPADSEDDLFESRRGAAAA